MSIFPCNVCLLFLFTADCKAYVIYISTDYVFDGKNPPYKEDATPNPLNNYGHSKLEGEKVTMEVSTGKENQCFNTINNQIKYFQLSKNTPDFNI